AFSRWVRKLLSRCESTPELQCLGTDLGMGGFSAKCRHRRQLRGGSGLTRSSDLDGTFSSAAVAPPPAGQQADEVRLPAQACRSLVRFPRYLVMTPRGRRKLALTQG